MAYIQKTTPPPDDVRYFSISDFSGGLNNRDSYMELGVNESSNLLNVELFKEQGVVSKRGGVEYKDELALVEAITLLDEVKGPSPKLIRATDAKMYAGDVEIKTLAGRAQGVSYQNKYIFTDGSGIYAYGSFPQDASTYVTFIGTPSPDNMVMQIMGEQGAYTPLGATHDIGMTIYDYTDKKIYYNPCENELSDESKGANFPPSTPTCIESKEGRIYCAGDDELPYSIFISDIQNPYYFPVSVGLQITPDGDKITTLIEFHDAILVGTSARWHAIYGNTNRTDLNFDLYTMKDLNTHTGIAGSATAKRVNNYVFYLGNDGVVYSLYTPQTDTTKVMTVILSSKLLLFEEPLSFNTDDFPNASAVFFEDNYWLSIGDKILVYSFSRQGWSLFDSINACSFLVKDYKLLIGNNAGRLVEYNKNSYSDLGEPIVSYWKSKRFDMGFPSRIKKFKEMFAVAKTFDTINSTVKVSFEVDYEDIESISTIKNAISRWGEALFGDRFISRNINKSLPIVINRRGRLISFTFANDVVGEGMLVYEINGEYELRGFR